METHAWQCAGLLPHNNLVKGPLSNQSDAILINMSPHMLAVGLLSHMWHVLLAKHTLACRQKSKQGLCTRNDLASADM